MVQIFQYLERDGNEIQVSGMEWNGTDGAKPRFKWLERKGKERNGTERNGAGCIWILNVIFKIFSIFVFHIRMRTICWIINPINFIKLCALSREKVVLNFFRFFFPQKKEKKEKKLIEVPILILRKYKIQYYNSVFRFISFYFAPDQEYLRM